MHRTLLDRFPHLRPAYVHGLALWVYGALLAQSACESAVLAALAPLGKRETTRQRLRDLLRASADKRVPCQCDWAVTACFAPLLCWVLSWWRGTDLALALDATSHGDHVVVLAISVLYRGTALPVAWQVLPANQHGEWTPHWLRLIALLAPAIPATMSVVVCTDRGLWSPRLWRALRTVGWQWQQTQRRDPDRVARHWLVLAIATLWTVAVGTRVEEAVAHGVCPTRFWRPPRQACGAPRTASLFAQGRGWLLRQAVCGRLWTRLWLLPEPWPTAPPHVTICSRDPPA